MSGLRNGTILIFFIALLLIVFLLFDNVVFAQGTKSSNTYPSVMIIPYQPSMYLTDMDMSSRRYIRNQNFTSDYNANNLLRTNIDNTLFDNLLVYFDIKRIFFYTNPQSIEDLELIYKSVGYEAKQQHLQSYYRNFPNFSIFRIISDGKNRWGVNCMAQEEVIPIVKNPMVYFNDLVIKDPVIFPYLNKKYHCDYYLFINAIELKTRFKVCMDLLHNVQQKDLILHFSLVDLDGVKVTGGLVGITYEPKGYNDIYEIIENNIGILTGLVADVIRDELNLSLRYDP